MEKKVFLVILLFLASMCCRAQKENWNWVFGDSAGISFTNGVNPSSFISAGSSFECTAALSDSNGNLMLYATVNGLNDSLNLYNRFNQITPNGKGVGDKISSYTQGSLLLQWPDSKDSLLLFTIGVINCPPCSMIVAVTFISMQLDSGRGDVISKNTLLSASYKDLAEKMIAIRHGNGRDWWLLLHEDTYPSNLHYIRYLITNNGILGPFTQNVPGSHMHFASDGAGQMAVNSQGDKIAFAGGGGTLDILDFDRCTGLLTMNMAIGDSTDPYYGCCFSPNGNFVYATAFNGGFSYNNLYQFDLIHNNKDTIWTTPDSVSLGQLQIGPDNKIYVVSTYGQIWQSTTIDSSNQYLSVINYPDSQGVSCGFVKYQVYLGGRRSFVGLPNLPNYNLGRLQGSACDTLLWTGLGPPAPNVGVTAYPNPAKEFVIVTTNDFQNTTLQITDVVGHLIQSQKLASNNEKVNLSSLKNGCYVIRFIKNGSVISTQKLIVIK